MRRATLLSSLRFSALALFAASAPVCWLACSGGSTQAGFVPPPNTTKDSGANKGDATTMGVDSGRGNPPPGDGGLGMQNLDTGLPDGAIVMTSTIYANTDTALYSLDPMSQTVTQVGIFSGLPDANYEAITDLAVNAAGDVYVNTESAVYQAMLPATPSATAPIPLTLVATIAVQASQYFYALAFTPPNALGAGTGEVLIGGDGNGELWSIATTGGATQDLGNFGPDSAHPGNTFALSGDIVFYADSMMVQTGLATIRSCPPPVGNKAPACIKTSDFLAGIDMTALATAYTSKVKATTLLKGIYGGSMTGAGAGTGYGDLFGLGAWNGKVFAFSRNIAANPTANPPIPTTVPPTLLTIDPTSGVGTPVAGQSWSFTDGWSGAGVTTTVTINIPKPPPPPQ